MRNGKEDGFLPALWFVPLLSLSLVLTRSHPGQEASVQNGERIYTTGTSMRGDPITADMGQGGMMGMMNMMGEMACERCHGPDGRGGEVRMMMRTFTAPDIRYSSLTGEDPDMEHPPYTDGTIKRAITEGVDPAGHELEWPMPRWTMSNQDLDDLIAYLKTLK